VRGGGSEETHRFPRGVWEPVRFAKDHEEWPLSVSTTLIRLLPAREGKGACQLGCWEFVVNYCCEDWQIGS